MCFLFLVAEVGFEPHDLRVMSPTSYQAAPLRDIWCRKPGSNRYEIKSHGILSPGRLPIPPFRHATTDWSSTLLYNYSIYYSKSQYFLKKSLTLHKKCVIIYRHLGAHCIICACYEDHSLLRKNISPLRKSQNCQHLTQYLTLSKITI